MRMMSIVGARPQFVKLAAVSRAVSRAAARGIAIKDFIVHTGQHYDAAMSDIFFEELSIPRPDVDLEVGSGSHADQTARMLQGIERLLVEQRPDAVVVYGDTNSTVAGALAAAKLRIPVVHVEAGLRSFNRGMPEEINRVATDHISDLLLAPTPTAVANLESEGLSRRSVMTGDVMFDAVLHAQGLAAERSNVLSALGLPAKSYGLVTIHRADNTEPAQLRPLLDMLNGVAASGLTLLFPVHPRTRKVIASELPDWTPHERFRLLDPLGYLDMVSVLSHAAVVLTDSGGLQKEAFFLGCPCITLRSETEWTETVDAGGNVVTGCDPDRVHAALDHWSRTPFNVDVARKAGSSLFGSGDAGDRTIAAVVERLGV